jgi:hypothetical protein
MQTIEQLEEDLMMNQFQESLIVANGASKDGLTMRSGYIQAAIGLVLVIAISAFGLFTASHANGQDGMARKTAQATTMNVLPPLFISDESQQPNLNGVLATGDGGAALPLEETVGGVSRNVFDHNR